MAKTKAEVVVEEEDIVDNFADPVDQVVEQVVEDVKAVEPEAPAETQETPETPETEAVDVQPADDAEPEAPVTDDGFPSELLRQTGLTPQQAKAAYGTAENLRNAILEWDKRFVEAGRQQLEQHQRPQQPPTNWQQYPPQYQQQPQHPPQQQQMPNQLRIQLDPEKWDKETQSLVDQIQAHNAQIILQQQQQIRNLQDAVGSVFAEREALSNRRYVEEFDSYIQKLPEQWKSVFGEGSGYELLNTNPQAIQNREYLDRIATQLEAGARSYGSVAARKSDILDRALRIAFPNIHDAQIKQDVVRQVQSRSNLVTARPTARQARELSAEEKAIAKAKAFYKERGISSTPGEDQDDPDYV